MNTPLSDGEDRAIAAICPGLGESVDPSGREDHTIWGPYLDMRTGHATDPELRYAASSGGALSAVLCYLLDAGIVDGVLQTKAAPQSPLANTTVLSTDPDAVKEASGSRYAPSSPLAALGPYLDSDKRYAFVGKPCDIAALRALAREDSRVDTRLPILLSFFCAGIPSLNGARRLLDALGVAEEETRTFRYRGFGWPGAATARLADGSERSMTYERSWGSILSKTLQHRCKICADGTGKLADLVFADAWRCDDRGYPLFEEADGISLVVARTNKGRDLRDGAEGRGFLATDAFDPSRLERIQPGQAKKHRALLARLSGLRACLRPVPRYRGMHLAAAARGFGAKANLRNFAGMVRRAVRMQL